MPVSAAAVPNPVIVYVADYGINSSTVTPIAVATDIPGNPIPVGTGPVSVAVTPDGTTAYVTNYVSATLTPITVATNTPGSPIPMGNHPGGIAIAAAPSTVPHSVPTSTQLSVDPPSPAAAGTLETLTATITPAAAAGTVQFTEATPIGMTALFTPWKAHSSQTQPVPYFVRNAYRGNLLLAEGQAAGRVGWRVKVGGLLVVGDAMGEAMVSLASRGLAGAARPHVRHR